MPPFSAKWKQWTLSIYQQRRELGSPYLNRLPNSYLQILNRLFLIIPMFVLRTYEMNMGHYLIFHRHAHPQIVLANVSSSIFFFSFFSSEKLTMSFNVSTRTLKKSDGLRISLMCCMVILRKILLLVRLTNHEISNTLGKSKIVCFFPPTLSFLHFFFCFFK